MAMLQNIRNKAGLLVAIIIGLALLAFVLGDFLNLGFTAFGTNQNELAQINGKTVSWEDYNKIVDKRSELFRAETPEQLDNIKEQIWQEIIQTIILEDEYKDLGLRVSDEEFEEMSTGRDLHPLVRQYFGDPQTGQVDRARLLQVINGMDENPEFKKFWTYLTNEMIRQRLFDKYNSLISSGLYATSLEAEMEQKENETTASFNYVVERFSSIPDSAIKISESDLKSYYKKHSGQFKQKESRDIEYVIFNILPSKEDDKQVAKAIEDLKDEFVQADSAKAARIVNFASNSGNRFDPTYYKKEELSDVIKEFAFSAQEGEVFGPYFENNAYKLSKVNDIKNLPDSVWTRHILINPTEQTQESVNRALELADSLFEVAKEGADFAKLARENSMDPESASKGGDLGWFTKGMYENPAFENAALHADKGEIIKVVSPSGIHIIEVLERGTLNKHVQMANVVKEVTPSRETRNKIYREAIDFATSNRTIAAFRNTADKNPTIELRTANHLTKSSRYIPGIDDPKPILAWAFAAEKNDVNNEVINIKEKMFVIPAVTEVREEGIAPLEQVKTQIEFIVKKEKKAEKIMEKMQNIQASDLNNFSEALNSPVEEATNITFAQSNIGIGNEPQVIAHALYEPLNKVTKPIKGENGVFVIKVLNRNETEGKQEIAQVRSQLQTNYKSRSWNAFQVLKDQADIEDNRLNTYRFMN